MPSEKIPIAKTADVSDNSSMGKERLRGVLVMEKDLRWITESPLGFTLALCTHTVFVVSMILMAATRF